MIKAKGNSGANRAPKPKSVMVFKGIKGLIASGPATKKTIDNQKLRPEQNEAKKIPSPPSVHTPKVGQSLPQKSAGVVMPHGQVSVMPGARPEPGLKRDSASVAKPFSA
jgi:hypothetical protein